MGRLSFHN